MLDTPPPAPQGTEQPPQSGGTAPQQNPAPIDVTQVKKVDAPAPKPQSATHGGEFEDVILDISANDQIKVEKKKNKSSINWLDPVSLYNALNDFTINHSPIKLQEKLLFFQLLASTLNAGISVTESLRLLSKQTKNARLQAVIRDMAELIEEGSSLAEAMERNEDVFDEATCSIVRAGEKSGKLNDVLKELVNQFEKLSTIQKKVKGVLMYPMIVMIVMVLIVIVVMVFVVPKLLVIFGEAKNLPLPTRILIAGSDLVVHKWPWLILGVVSFLGVFISWKRSRMGKRQWAIIMLYFPVVKIILRGMIISKVTRIFGFLIASGVPIIEGLKISASIAKNPLYEERLLFAADDLGKGIPIAENLADNEHLFPSMLVNMIAIGERTASLETIMGKIADFYEDELNRIVENLSKLMEPFTLGIIAAGAVFLILAIYLPILKMNDNLTYLIDYWV